MNRTNVLDCIQRHLNAARMEPGGLRPLGELLPRIADELRIGLDTTDFQPNITPIPLVAAFIDGVVSPEEERVVCQAILIDNSVLAELVAGVLALDETQSNLASLPPISRDLSARLFELTAQLMPNNSNAIGQTVALVDALESEQVRAPKKNDLDCSLPSPAKSDSASAWKDGFEVPANRQANKKWLGPTIALLAMAASLFLIVWWTVKNSPFWQDTEQVVQVAPLPQDRDENPPQPTEYEPQLPRDEGLALQEPEQDPETPPEQPSPLPPPVRQNMPQVVVAPPPVTPSPPAPFAATPMDRFQWSKIAGLLARKAVNSDYADDTGWQGVNIGDSASTVVSDALQLLTLPQSRAEADIASGGRIVLAGDTRLTISQASGSRSAKVDLSHGVIAFVELPQDTVIEFNGSDHPLAVARWMTPKATLLLTVTDAGLQAQVTGGEVAVNQQSVRNSVVAIDSQSVREVKMRNMRLPAWVDRPVESVPLPKTVLAQLAGSSNITETLDRLLEATAAAGEADHGRLMLSNWRASLSDSNLLRVAESRSPLVRMQALQRLMALPEWDVRYKRSWAKFSTTINNEVEFVFLRQAVEATRRGGQLNAVQINQLVNLLESSQFSVRSLSDFVLRKNLGGGPQFDPTLNPQANARGIGLWRRYINAIRNTPTAIRKTP